MYANCNFDSAAFVTNPRPIIIITLLYRVLGKYIFFESVEVVQKFNTSLNYICTCVAYIYTINLILPARLQQNVFYIYAETEI